MKCSAAHMDIHWTLKITSGLCTTTVPFFAFLFHTAERHCGDCGCASDFPRQTMCFCHEVSVFEETCIKVGNRTDSYSISSFFTDIDGCIPDTPWDCHNMPTLTPVNHPNLPCRHIWHGAQWHTWSVWVPETICMDSSVLIGKQRGKMGRPGSPGRDQVCSFFWATPWVGRSGTGERSDGERFLGDAKHVPNAPWDCHICLH